MGKQNKDSLGDRMKGYESVSRNFLMKKTPAIIRIDGKAFHTFTKGLKKPFDAFLVSVMQDTMRELCGNVQGCVFGYTQSDEITLVLTDYSNVKTDAWFEYNVQKMTSVAASMATLFFNRNWRSKFYEIEESYIFEHSYIDLLADKLDRALFDARAFSVPVDEVINCLIWRQQDAIRNSIEAVGQANFSHKELQFKNCDEIQDMLLTEKGINWNDLPTILKRGSACYKTEVEKETVLPNKPNEKVVFKRSVWMVDEEIPIFTENREYIERLL